MAVKPFDFTKSATKKTTGATSGRTSQIPTLSVLAGTAVQQVTVLPIALLDAHPGKRCAATYMCSRKSGWTI